MPSLPVSRCAGGTFDPAGIAPQRLRAVITAWDWLSWTGPVRRRHAGGSGAVAPARQTRPAGSVHGRAPSTQ
jgi:hypothetical protein